MDEYCTCALLQGRHIENAIGINVKGDLDLGYSSGCRWNTRQVKLPQQVVVLGASSLSLIDLDGDSWLIVAVCAEGLQQQWDGSIKWRC